MRPEFIDIVCPRRGRDRTQLMPWHRRQGTKQHPTDRVWGGSCLPKDTAINKILVFKFFYCFLFFFPPPPSSQQTRLTFWNCTTFTRGGEDVWLHRMGTVSKQGLLQGQPPPVSPPCATRGLGAWHRAAAGRAQLGAHRCSWAALQHQRTQPEDSLPSIELSHLISRLFVIPFAFGRGQQPVQPDVTERPRSRMSPSTDPFSPPFWGMFLQYPAAEAHPTLPVIFPRVPAPAWPCPRSLSLEAFLPAAIPPLQPARCSAAP